jgi:hypothetical protein
MLGTELYRQTYAQWQGWSEAAEKDRLLAAARLSSGERWRQFQALVEFSRNIQVVPGLDYAAIRSALLLGVAIIVWSAAFVQRRRGGLVLMLLSVALLLFGGGIFPPVIGLAGGAAGTRINKPVTGKPTGGLLRLAARLWPWPLVIFLVWTLGQFVVGYFFNDFLQSVMGLGVLLILATLPLSVYSAYAHDVVSAQSNPSQPLAPTAS